jgi:glycosyltransferase involved in cell wall biosynthesis
MLFMTVSVMITTTGRIVDLRRTWRALQQLDPRPLEILITADGCTNDLVEAVQADLPEARLLVNRSALGSVALRDRMMRAARGDLVLALDDDSYPEQLDCIGRIVPTFEQQILAPVATRCWEIGLAVDRKSRYEGGRS